MCKVNYFFLSLLVSFLVVFFGVFFDVGFVLGLVDVVDDFFDLVDFLVCFGNARQCALVFTPFLFTEDFLHVQIDLAAQDVLDRPTHLLCACDTELTDNILKAIDIQIRIFFIVRIIVNIFVSCAHRLCSALRIFKLNTVKFTNFNL